MNLFQNIALNNHREGQRIVAGYGMQPANEPEGLTRQLAQCVKQHGDSALNQLALAHPDRELILATGDRGVGNWNNACGCGGSHSNFSNMDGQHMKAVTEKEITTNPIDNKGELLIMGGVILIALALILKK